MLTTIVVHGTTVLLGYPVCSVNKPSNAVGFIGMYTNTHGKLWEATLKITFTGKLLHICNFNLNIE